MTKAKINRAIKHLGLEIQGNRRDGYHYFTRLDNGDQQGQSVPVCYLRQASLAQWVSYARCSR
jgi:hypothetical protein